MTVRDEAIIALYDTGQLSYNAVAQKMGIGVGEVRGVMHEQAPELIRTSIESQIKVRQRNTNPHEISLGSLGLYRVGPCVSCKVEMVSGTRESGQACGLCLAARAA